MSESRVTAGRGLYLGCGFVLVACALAWVASGVDARDLRRFFGFGDGPKVVPLRDQIIRMRIASMDAELRRGDRAAFVSAYADAAAGEAAWAAVAPVASAATEVLSLVPEGEGWREVSVLRVVAPPGGTPARRELRLERLWMPGAEAGAWWVAGAPTR